MVGAQHGDRTLGGDRTWGVQLSTPRCAPQCWEVRKRNSSEWCHFVRSNPDCRLEGGFLDYLDGVFCVFPPRLLPLAVTLYVRMGTGVMLLGDAHVWGCRLGTPPTHLSAIPNPSGSLAPVPVCHPRRDSREVVSSPVEDRMVPRVSGEPGGPKAALSPLCASFSALPASARTYRPSPPT